MSERELRFAFQELAAGVRPAPEPYARLMARSRRRRFSRWITGCVAALAALVLAPVALNAADEPGPDLGPIDNQVLLITPWTRKLIDAAPRGGLAGDKAFLNDMTKRLRASKTGPMHGYPTKVLFAEDIGDRRVVVAVRHSKTHQFGVAVVAARGAGVPEFAVDDPASLWMKSLTPFSSIEFSTGVAHELRHTGVGLAPPGCAIAQATHSPEAPQWKTTPAGDYLVWSQSVADQLVRVTCAGARRFEGALADRTVPSLFSDLDVYARRILAGTGFDVPDDVIHFLLMRAYPPQAVGPMRMLAGGPVAGVANPVYIAADPVDKGRWRVQVLVGSGSSSLLTSADVLAADAVIAVDNPDNDSDRLIVVGPPLAVKAELRQADTGALLASVPLVKGVGSVTQVGAEDVLLRAFDAAGKQIGSGVAPLPRASTQAELFMPMTSENWN